MNVKGKVVIEMGRARCPAGKILRKPFSFVRDGKRVTVPATCVEDRGAPGKTPEAKKWAKEIPGLRGPYGVTAGSRPTIGRTDKAFIPGWEAKDPASKRRGAVKRNVAREGCLTVSRKLVVVRNLNFRQNPSVAKKAMADRAWAVKKDWCKLKGKKK